MAQLPRLPRPVCCFETRSCCQAFLACHCQRVCPAPCPHLASLALHQRRIQLDHRKLALMFLAMHLLHISMLKLV